MSRTTGYSKLCRSHRTQRARHGHPFQTPVSVHELRPYVRMVAARWAKAPENPAWAILGQRWARLVQLAEEAVGRYASGEPAVRHQVQAAQLIRNLAGSVSVQSIIETALGMYLLADAQPQRFRSDEGFRCQLVRRVRLLTHTSAGSYWCPKTGRVKKVYRDLPPRTAAVLAELLVDAIGAAGLQLASIERRAKVDHAAIERQRLADAIEALA